MRKIYDYYWRFINANEIGTSISFNNNKVFSDIAYPTYSAQHVKQKLNDDTLSFRAFNGCVVFKDVYIDPSSFLLFANYRTIISETQFYEWQRPSVRAFLKETLIRRRHSIVNEGVLFDSFVGLNYFHFYNDILPNVSLIYEYQLDSLPILIGERLFNTKWFQFFLGHSKRVGALNWRIVSGSEYIKAKKIFFLRSVPYSSKNYEFINELVGSVSLPIISKKLFVNRSPDETRHIRNYGKLQGVLKKMGFVNLNLRDLSIRDQIAIFRKANFIIGPHGAGLVNLIFCQSNNVKLLEIFPSDFISAHYYWLSSVLGIKHGSFCGSVLTESDAGRSFFDVDVDAFISVLEKFEKQ